MPSPFPGMDPYLENEKLWPVFHHQLVVCLLQFLSRGLVDRFKPLLCQRHYTTVQALFTSVVQEQRSEDFLEIRHRKEGRLVTLIEVVSPDNKTTQPGRQAYLEKRREGKAMGANLVEIDLVAQGGPIANQLRQNAPDQVYAVTVARPNQPERFEIKTATLRQKLPRFRLPLIGDDIMVDLGAVFSTSYDQGNFFSLVDYGKDPVVALREEDRDWIREHLHELKLR